MIIELQRELAVANVKLAAYEGELGNMLGCTLKEGNRSERSVGA